MNNDSKSYYHDRIVREPERRKLTGVCRTTCYMMEKEGKFPARRRLGGRSVGWLLSEITEWQQAQPKAELGNVA